MGKKSRGKEEQEFVVSIKGLYKNNIGITEMTETKVKGNNAIIVSACLGLVHTLCNEANVNYREMLSNEIKRVVYQEAVERTEKMREEEANNGQ